MFSWRLTCPRWRNRMIFFFFLKSLQTSVFIGWSSLLLRGSDFYRDWQSDISNESIRGWFQFLFLHASLAKLICKAYVPRFAFGVFYEQVITDHSLVSEVKNSVLCVCFARVNISGIPREREKKKILLNLLCHVHHHHRFYHGIRMSRSFLTFPSFWCIPLMHHWWEWGEAPKEEE